MTTNATYTQVGNRCLNKIRDLSHKTSTLQRILKSVTKRLKQKDTYLMKGSALNRHGEIRRVVIGRHFNKYVVKVEGDFEERNGEGR